jgi:hypothetical protein
MTAPLDDVQVVTVETPGAGTPTVITVEVPGIQGPPGIFAFGTVATGAPGTEASATVTPDAVNPEVEVVNLTIPRGDVGPAADLTVGAVESLLSEDTPTVTITGSAPNQVINFGIPRGVKGDKGDQGPQGLQGIQGPPGTPGANGKDGAGISISGEVATYANLPTGLTSADAGKAYIVDADGKLYIWSGTAFPANGSGQTFVGPAGPANSITLGTITTSAAGSAADATFTGASPNQILNLTIPRGADGANGADGVPGPGLASGGAAGDVAMKNSTADFDTKWATPVSTATVNALMKRDSAGRAQVVDPSASADISTKNYVDTQITANKAPNATSSTRGLVTLAQMSPPPSSGTYASRPSATTVLTGTLYYATDTKETYRATGTNGVNATSWTVIPAGGTELDYAERTTDFALPAGNRLVGGDWSVGYHHGARAPLSNRGGVSDTVRRYYRRRHMPAHCGNQSYWHGHWRVPRWIQHQHKRLHFNLFLPPCTDASADARNV